MANFVALKSARDAKAGWDVRISGVRQGPPLTFYASEEAHVVIDRASDMLGMGLQGVRKVPTDGDRRMRLDALRALIDQDRASGARPVAVVGTAGTVATGSIDPLEDIAELCGREGLWFHVDGAYGGPAVLADDLRPLFAGIERADSIAFDPHKWLYTPHSGGCVLLRDSRHLTASFSAPAAYIHEDKERSGHGIDLGMMGPQFSRGFQAFKVWVSLLAHGRLAYARRISHDAELARYMGSRVDERSGLELAVPVGLSICCFRYVPPDLPPGEGREEYLDVLNERLMTEIHLDGRVFISNAVLGGRFVLRACIVNFRTEAEDVDAVLEVALELGAKLDAELRPGSLRTATG
jgi:aromatic-L-amino-acid decarboxylase